MNEREIQTARSALGYLTKHRLEQPSLGELAAHVGVSRHHLSRLFHRAVGLSPGRYVAMLTASHAEALLADGVSVLDAALATGLSGPARLHDLVTAVHAVTPGELKRGGAELTIRWGFTKTPFGECLIGITPRGVCHLGFVTDGRAAARQDLRARWPEARLVEDATGATHVADTVFSDALRRGRRGVELFVRGTNFQVRVWEALLCIPEGCAISYGDLAAALGRDAASARAVGNAVGANPVGWLIPCHRVLRANGALGGYRWGVSRKKRMLRAESRPEIRGPMAR
jgi:AraC family transcriptional regulator of adaptative response/methylated-DNA-[protein]-cysteine methyltransferase